MPRSIQFRNSYLDELERKTRKVTREEVKPHWPYNTHRFGIVYQDLDCPHQEKMYRKLCPNTDKDLIMMIVLKSDERILIPLESLIDF